MSSSILKRSATLILAGALVLTGCKGDTGPAGPPGTASRSFPAAGCRFPSSPPPRRRAARPPSRSPSRTRRAPQLTSSPSWPTATSAPPAARASAWRRPPSRAGPTTRRSTRPPRPASRAASRPARPRCRGTSRSPMPPRSTSRTKTGPTPSPSRPQRPRSPRSPTASRSRRCSPRRPWSASTPPGRSGRPVPAGASLGVHPGRRHGHPAPGRVRRGLQQVPQAPDRARHAPHRRPLPHLPHAGLGAEPDLQQHRERHRLPRAGAPDPPRPAADRRAEHQPLDVQVERHERLQHRRLRPAQHRQELRLLPRGWRPGRQLEEQAQPRRLRRLPLRGRLRHRRRPRGGPKPNDSTCANCHQPDDTSAGARRSPRSTRSCTTPSPTPRSPARTSASSSTRWT